MALGAREEVGTLEKRVEGVKAEYVREREHAGFIVYLAANAQNSQLMRLCVNECHAHISPISHADECIGALVKDVVVNCVPELAGKT